MPKITFETKWLAPLGTLCAFLVLWSFMFFPMLNGTAKNVPYAVLSLDEGTSVANTTINIGDQLVENLTDPDSASKLSSDDSDSTQQAIAWTVFTSQKDLDDAMNGNDYYGAIVIPEDYTAKTIAAKQAQTQSALQLAQAQQQAQAQLQQQLARAKAQGATEEQLQHMQADAAAQTLKAQNNAAQSETDAGKSDEPTITIITNGAKNASVAQQLATQMSSKLKESGVNVETSTVHDHDLGSTTGAQMIGQLSTAPIIAMSASCTMLMFMMTRTGKNASRKERIVRFALQTGYALGLSACVAGLACFLMGVIGGLTLPFGTVFPFLWMASFCIMAMLIGLMTLLFPLGTVGMFTLMGTMSCAYIAPEMLPAFFLDWIYPWSPSHFVVDGVRGIVFLGDGAFNTSLGALAVCLIIGVISAAIGLALPNGNSGKSNGAASTQTVVDTTTATAIA